MLSYIQYDFLGHLHHLLHLSYTLSTHTHIVFHVVKENDKDCVGIKLYSLQDLRPAVSQRLLQSKV